MLCVIVCLLGCLLMLLSLLPVFFAVARWCFLQNDVDGCGLVLLVVICCCLLNFVVGVVVSRWLLLVVCFCFCFNW